MVGCGDNGVTPPDAPPDIDAALPGPAVLAISPSNNQFGAVVVGDTSAAATFTVTNTGESPSGTISAIATGADVGSFGVTNGCTTLASGGTCMITVTFSPQTAGDKSASLNVSASPGGAVMAALAGTGQNPGNLSISPPTHAFGDLVVGATSTVQTFTVENTGNVTIPNLTVSASGDSTHFSKTSDTCNNANLAGGATCTFQVAFAPQSAGAKSASYVVSGGGVNSTTAVVTGNALAPAQLAITPTLPDFGTVVTGNMSTNVTFTVSNTGGVATGTISAALATGNPTEFEVVSTNCTTLNPGATCNVIARFRPTTTGSKSTVLTVSATPGNSAAATLLGTGVTPGSLHLSDNNLAFGDVLVGQQGTSQTVTVTNNGGSATGTLTTALAGQDPTQFQFVAGGNSCQGAPLAANASCTISIVFAPTLAGAKSANITITGAGSPATVGLTGTGIAPARLDWSPTSRDYGSVGIGSTSGTLNFTLTNNGGVTTGSTPMITRGGANDTDFVISSNNCNAALSPGQSCIVGVRFAPQFVGAKSATLIATATAGGPATANLFGTGVAPAAIIVVGPAGSNTHDFGTILLGNESGSHTFTIENTGTEPTSDLSVTAGGDNPGDFNLSDTCGILVEDAQCTVTVTFEPTAVGQRDATITISGAPGGTVILTVVGDALRKIDLTAPSMNPFDFGAIVVNTLATNSVTVTARNNDTVARTFTAVLSTSVHYTALSNGCHNSSIAAGASCDVVVRFRPTAVGNDFQATVTFTAAGGGLLNTAVQTLTGDSITSLLIDGPDATTTPAQTISQSFGALAVGTTTNLTFNVKNPAGAPNTGALLTNITNGPFQIVSDGCAGTSLLTDDTCTIVVRFAPAAQGPAPTGTLTVTATNMSAGGTVTANLTGTGLLQADLSVSTATLAFGDVFSGDTRELSFTVRNPANTATTGTLSFSSLSPPFIRLIGASGDCTAANTLDANESCTVRIRYAPTGASATNVDQSATFTVSATPGGSEVVNLTGTRLPAITITPTTHDFGPRDQGSTTSQGFTVRNISAHTVTINSSILSNDASAQLAITGNTCTTLVPNAPCTVTVRFAPAVAATGQDITSNLTVSSADGVAVANITARRRSPANLEFTESFPTTGRYDFGTTLAGEDGGIRTFTVRNIGESTSSTITAASITNTTDYTLTGTCVGMQLAANGTCSVTVQFTPESGGSIAQLDAAVGVTAASDGVTAINVTGRRVAAVGNLILAPSSATYANTVVGDTTASQTFMLTNTAAGSVNYASIAVRSGNTPGDAASPDFTITGGSCVPGGGTIGAGQTCTIDVAFSPSVGGALQRFLSVDTNASDNYAVLRGTGLTQANVTVTPTSLTFGATATGTQSAQQTVTVTNTGGVSSGPIAVTTLSGNDPSQFLVTNGCAGALPGNQTPPASCTITVRFTPTSVGTKTAQFSVSANPGNTTGTTVSLTGSAVLNAVLGMTPSVAQTDAQSPRPVLSAFTTGTTFTITNGGAVPSGPLVITLGGANPADFQIGATSTCMAGVPLAANGDTCTVIVQFRPTAVGNRSTVLRVEADPDSFVTNTISGVGQPSLAANPTTETFTAAVGGSSSVETITFTNRATVATGQLSVSLSGNHGSQWSIVDNTCSGVSVAAGGTCTVDVGFVPQGGAGSRSATLTVSGTPGDSASAALSGTVTP